MKSIHIYDKFRYHCVKVSYLIDLWNKTCQEMIESTCILKYKINEKITQTFAMSSDYFA